jgi:sRNA-binding carbon storage regulator CsrA
MNPKPIRITRQELYQQVWSKTLRTIERELGTSYVELVRACHEMKVPRPLPGHWENVRLGTPVQQIPLPEAGADMSVEALLRPKGKVVSGELPPLPNDKPKEEAAASAAPEPQSPSSHEAIKVKRQELYEKIWSTSVNGLARQLGTTYVQLVAACDAMNVPRPRNGYWRRLELNLPVQRIPLPDLGPGNLVEASLERKGERKKRAARLAQQMMEKSERGDPVVIAVAEASEGGAYVHTSDGAIQQTPTENGNPFTVAGSASEAVEAPRTEQPKIVEYSREQLYKAIWSTPCLKLAASLGMSDVALAKTCRRLGIPRPPRGYWAKVEAGDKPSKERLPEAKPGQDKVVRFNVARNVSRRENFAVNNVLTAGKSRKVNPLELTPEGSELHAIVEKQKQALMKAKPDELGYVLVRGKSLFACDVSSQIIPKLIRAMDAIVCELDDRDYEFEPSDSEYLGLRIVKDKDEAGLRWSEKRVEIEREPTNVDKRKPSWTWNLKETKPSGALTVEVSAPGLRGKRQWTEGDGRTLEEILGVVLEKIEATFRGFEEQRQREAQWAKEREEERKRDAERQAKEAERKVQAEKERKERERLDRHEGKLDEVSGARSKNLMTAAQRWIDAEGVMAFINLCEQRWREAGEGNLTPEQMQWSEWARTEAARKHPWAVGYPDPAKDGGFDRTAVPIGGPYPASRKFEEQVPNETLAAPKSEVKTVYVEVPRPEPFPYWHLHRKH